MEKLIELLNEYRNDGVEEYLENIKSFKIKWWHYSDLYIISKKFWFIKWLVDNEKIEWEKVYENLKDYEVEIRIRTVKKLELSSEEKSLWYLELLMLLSIQDEPINFLCSILR